MGAYFLKKQARSPILEGFGRNIYALLSFSGQQYFQKVELADRQPLYVSRTTHEKLMRIVTVIGGRKVTVSSYVENILLRHFEQYQDEINTLYESHFQKPF